MKMTAVLLLATCLQLSARTYSQTVSLSVKNAALEKVFAAIQKQSGYSFYYKMEILTHAQPVSIDVKNAPLEQVLSLVFKNQPFSYTIVDKNIGVKEKEPEKKEAIPNVGIQETPPPPTTVHGRVTNESGEPVAGVTVSIKGGKAIGSTDDRGEFSVTVADANLTLVFSAVTIETFEVKLNGRTELTLNVKTKTNELGDVVVNKGYYTTSKRFNVGNVTTVKGEDIQRQPVGDPILALEGRVAGLSVTPVNGVPGSNTIIRVRGLNSLANGNNPLIIIDGVPFTSNTLSINGGGGGGLSPFDALNSADIETIDVLKDADATAIYGSRGANGVILITTKKGKAGRTSFTVNAYAGAGKVTKTMDLLNTQQYVQMRKQAYANDGIATLPSNAYDVNGAWDTTRYTDWQNIFIGGTARIENIQASFSGGNANTKYLVSATHRKETTVFPGDFSNKKTSVYFNLSNVSNDQKFRLNLSASYLLGTSVLPVSDLTTYIVLAPDAPALYDSVGQLNWQNNTWTNPFATLRQTNKSASNNLVGAVDLSYELLPGLSIKSNLGYNSYRLNETDITPLSAYNPVITITSLRSNYFSTNEVSTWNIEPQISYVKRFGASNFNILVGSTFSQSITSALNQVASNFSSDAVITNVASASSIVVQKNSLSKYRYNALFARMFYAYKDKYILNVTARRDGSSRFGPESRFGNFGAIGAGWIFSKENFIRSQAQFLSYGKLWTSIGTTGNEQIGDYAYLSTYSPFPYTYQNVSGLLPTGLTNPDYGWEQVKKMEVGLELGFFSNRISLDLSYYLHRTDNQLVAYPLPTITGGSSVKANLPATIENKGLEIRLNTTNVQSKDLQWTTSLNITFPRNKLVSFPNLNGSAYANRYEIGRSLYIQRVYHYTGIDPQTGLYMVEDVDKDGSITNPGDLTSYKDTEQKFYGGFQNRISYKAFELDFLFQFVRQNSFNYLRLFDLPGARSSSWKTNQPTIVLNRWQKPGDNASVQRYSQDFGAPYTAYSEYFKNSDEAISDASFIRLKSLSLYYNFPTAWLNKNHMQSLKLFVQCQNLFTITNYLGLDPETSSLLPPLRMITGGIQIIL